jgi:hypothetical protein
MSINRAELFRLAWTWTNTDEAARVVYDWTPGATYGHRRPATATERRAFFVRHLKAAWAEMKRIAAYRAAQTAAFAAFLEAVCAQTKAPPSAGLFLASAC